MKIKDILDALKGLDPEKEIKIVGTYYDYEVVGIFDGEFGVEVEVKEA
jgi:hypothetical protein